MVFVAAASLAVAVVLAVLLARARTAERTLADRLAAVSAERDAALAGAAEASERAALAGDERDDALERVHRARRDATEVANRLQDEVAARTALDQRRQDAEAERDQALATSAARQAEIDALHADLDGVRAELAARPAPGGPAGDPAVLWALALERIERLWRTSISVRPGEPSPIETADEPLKAALEVLAEAVHEESGADITVRWEGDTPVPAARAVLALAVAESVVAGLAKSDERTEIVVRPGEEGVEIVVDAGDPAAADELDLPEVLAAGAGRYLVA